MYHYRTTYLSDFFSVALNRKNNLQKYDKLFRMKNMINNWVYNNQNYEIVSLNTSSQLHSSL